MHLERVTGAAHPDYGQALALYGISFPEHEQREAFSQAKILSDPAYHFCLIRDGACFAGLALYWEDEQRLYVEHLCILPQMRNRGYGAGALGVLKQTGKTVILEIDPPVDAISQRRKGFYQRCGFVENPYAHVHPPYHRGNAGHALVVMTYPRALSPEEYRAFAKMLRTRVMADAY